jgi:WhiB family transcriptional regulator, redox-sensing transcriptional regulator
MTLTSVPPADWRTAAACRHADADVFFPEGDPSVPAVAAQVAEALSVCAGCPVRTQCRDFALGTRQKWGVWGGTTEDERSNAAQRERARQMRENRRAA